MIPFKDVLMTAHSSSFVLPSMLYDVLEPISNQLDALVVPGQSLRQFNLESCWLSMEFQENF